MTREQAEAKAREVLAEATADWACVPDKQGSTFYQAANIIASLLLETRREALEEAAKVVEECTDSYVENPAIDFYERSRRMGIRWGGEYSVMRIRSRVEELEKERDEAYNRGADFHGRRCDAHKQANALRAENERLKEDLAEAKRGNWEVEQSQAITIERQRKVVEAARRADKYVSEFWVVRDEFLKDRVSRRAIASAECIAQDMMKEVRASLAALDAQREGK